MERSGIIERLAQHGYRERPDSDERNIHAERYDGAVWVMKSAGEGWWFVDHDGRDPNPQRVTDLDQLSAKIRPVERHHRVAA